MQHRDGLLVRSRWGAATLLFLCAAAILPARAAMSQSAATPLERGDEAFAAGRLTDARAAYQEALGSQPGDFHVLCRLARTESELGEDAKGEDRRKMVASAVEHARGAVAAAPDSAAGHVWLAVALGRQALKEGPKGKLALAREIKSEVDRALQIDPANGRAFHVRGAWNRELASLNFFERAAANTVLGGVPKGASMENAVRDFEKAVELEPDHVNHRLELGRTYMKVDRRDDARRELEKAVELAPGSSPRDAKYQEEARELLAKLRRKD